MRAILLVNPKAACGNKLRQIKVIERTLTKTGFELVTYNSKGYRDLYKQAKEARKKFDVVIAVGGDGTIKHVVNGLVGSRYPGEWKLWPRAKYDDGCLDLLVAKNKDAFNTLKYFLLSKNGKHLDLSDIFYTHAKQIRISSKRKVNVQADGEYIGTTPATISVVPHALRLIVP